MNVSVKEFRNSVDHLYRMANVDYHACVGAQELRYWVERVERVIGLVEALEWSQKITAWGFTLLHLVKLA